MPDPKQGAPVKTAFVRPAEDSSSMLERLDFSQAFKSTNLGTALCFTNPMHQKFLDKTLQATQRQKHRRGVALYHTQRTFFISQVFEKGLNPYLKKAGKENKAGNKPQHSHSARAASRQERGQHEGRASYEYGGSYTQRPQTQNTPKPADEKSENLPFLRSKTLSGKKSVQIWDSPSEPQSAKSKSRSSRSADKDRKNSPKAQRRSSDGTKEGVDKSLPKIKEDPAKTKAKSEVTTGQSSKEAPHKSTKLPKLSEEDEEGDDNDGLSEFSHCASSPVPDEKSEEVLENPDNFDMSMNNGPTRSQRKDITYLKRNPSMLFPKMNELIVRDLLGENQPFDLEAEQQVNVKAKRPSHVSKEDTKEVTKVASAKKKSAKKKKKTSSSEGSSMDYVKLIQKLTTYLPDHLADTAKEQIREMTQTEAIYEQKEKILSHNKSKLKRELSLGDERWEKLETSLSSTHGINTKWKRVRPTGAWIKVQDI